MENSYIQFSISLCDYARINDFDNYLNMRIEDIKRRGAVEIFEKIYNSPTPIVVDTHMEIWDDPMMYCKYFRLHYRLTAVRTMDVVMMPEISPLTFTNHLGVIEWKCPACSIINSIEATYCGEKHEHAIGCGRPREKTRQEMYG